MVRMMFASILAALGYLLVYSGVAAAGKYALRPWDALLSPAQGGPDYSYATAGASSGGGGGGGSGLVGTVEGIGSKVISVLGGGLP